MSVVHQQQMTVCLYSVQSLSRVRLFATPRTAAHQASLSITSSWTLLKLMSIESVMPPNHLILSHPFLLLPSVFPSVRLCIHICSYVCVSVCSHSQLFATPWTAAHQASLSITSSQSLLKLICIKTVMPSNHLILCRPLLLLPSTFPSIRVFSNESGLCIKWP